VGASSGLGAELARQLAAQGCRVALVARRASELQALADSLQQEYPAELPRALPFPHDVTCTEEVPALFQQICRDLGGLDLFVYTAGVMPRLLPDEFSTEKDQTTIAVNITGAVAWLNVVAQRFQAAQSGTIVGIGSVAGDRGRNGQPVYGASKAFLETYLEAVRNRVGRHGVRVVTIKPGPLETPMTEGLGKLPLMIPAHIAAKGVLKAAQQGKREAYIPWQWRYIMTIIRAIPSPLFQKMNL